MHNVFQPPPPSPSLSFLPISLSLFPPNELCMEGGDGGRGVVVVGMEENGEMEKKREVMSPAFLCLFFFFFFFF